MCYLDQYTCEYTDWFYRGRFKEFSPEYKFYSRMYYEKLPEPFRTRIIKDFSNLEIDGRMKQPTLGVRTWYAKKRITDYCIEANEQKQIYRYQKRQLCC